MISAIDQISFDQALAAQQAGQQNTGSAGGPAQFAAQFAQMLAASQSQGQNSGQQATPASLTFSANVLATQVSQASQSSQTVDPNAAIAAQIQSNLTAQAAQTPAQAKSLQDSLVLQSLNYQASLAMSQGNIPALMTLQTMITKQMTSMGLIPEQAKATTVTTTAENQTSPAKTATAKTTAKTSAKTAAMVAAAAASASSAAASNASTESSASTRLTDTLLSNAGTAGSASSELASNAGTASSASAQPASNAGTGGATTAQSQNQPGPADPADEFDALQAELDALLADLDGESLDAALDSLASMTSKYGSAKAA